MVDPGRLLGKLAGCFTSIASLSQDFLAQAHGTCGRKYRLANPPSVVNARSLNSNDKPAEIGVA